MLIGYLRTDMRAYRAQELHFGHSWMWCPFLVTTGRCRFLHLKLDQFMEVFFLSVQPLIFLLRRNSNSFFSARHLLNTSRESSSLFTFPWTTKPYLLPPRLKKSFGPVPHTSPIQTLIYHNITTRPPPPPATIFSG